RVPYAGSVTRPGAPAHATPHPEGRESVVPEDTAPDRAVLQNAAFGQSAAFQNPVFDGFDGPALDAALDAALQNPVSGSAVSGSSVSGSPLSNPAPGGADGRRGVTRLPIYAVARHAGVSSAWVSRVLNGHATPRPETRDRVLRAVAELGFVPDGAARALSSRLKEIIAVVYRRSPLGP